MVRPPRLERGTPGLEGRCSIQLSYGRTKCRCRIVRDGLRREDSPPSRDLGRDFCYNWPFAGSIGDRKPYARTSGGWAPAAWTPKLFAERLGVVAVPASGVNAATVPGAVSGYDALLKRFGTLTFRETFERAARIAEEGWGQA